jgi:hypothetical protein
MDYRCTICNKNYKSYQSLWNHNKKFHNNENTNSPLKFDNCPLKFDNCPLNIDKSQKIYSCKICNKSYNNKNSKWSHEQKCKNTNSEIEKINAENKQKELSIILLKEEKEILKLKLKLEKSNKIDNITLKKLNKKLLERNNLIKNSTVNSHNTHIQNNIVNNFQLVGFGKEEIVELLTNKEKKLIMNAKYGCLEKLIETVHCGKYNQFKNIIITNMKDQYMYKYDANKGQFILSTKIDVLNSLINYRLDDLEVIYNDLLEDNKLDEKTKDIIEEFVNKINYSDSKFTDSDGKDHETYKQYKINEIKVLLYNNQDKITNDISLLLTTNEIPFNNNINECIDINYL